MANRPNITKLSDDVEFWNILLSSDSGTGKTVFAGSDMKVLFIAPEDKGLISAKRINTTANADKITVKQWEDVKNTYEWFDENPEECEKYNVFSIDSITELQYLAKDYVIRYTAAEKRRKNQDPDKMQIQDYGMMHDLVESMVRGFNDLPVNVLYTATAKQVKDADENPFIVPELTGKGDYGFSMKMVALMTCYGYMRTEIHDVSAPTEEDPKATRQIKRRVIYWEDTGTIRGKDRTVTLAPYTVNMTLQQMRKAISGEMKRSADGRIVKPANPNDKPVVKAAPKKPVVQTSPPANDKVESVKVTKPEDKPQDEPVEPPKLTGEVGQKFDKPATEEKEETKTVTLETVEA